MTPEEELDKLFEETVARVNAHTEPFPADFLLRLYAFFKKATNNIERPSSREPIINAFKTNAIFQIKNISPEDAKRTYIDLATKYFLYRES